LSKSVISFAKLKVHHLGDFMAEEIQNQSGRVAHATSPKIEQKENIYQAEYFGSGTFQIVKPKRQSRKRRQSALKGTTRGSRK
jgi:flagellar biosynthesis chaperone FliJ